MRSDGQAPDRRVSDAEREQVVSALRRHVADGRLDLDEFSERLDRVYGARTATDLESTLRDLPVIVEPEPAHDPGARRAFRDHLARYLIVNLFLVGIWLVTGAGHFWPAYPILGWGMAVAIHAWKVHGDAGGEDVGGP